MDSEFLQALIASEPPREEGKHRFMAGTCVDCGHPLDEICTANLQLETQPAAPPQDASTQPE